MGRTGIMLAYPYSEKRLLRWNKFIIQPKLNGMRCRTIIKDGKALMLSSQENVITSVPHIAAQLEEAFKYLREPLELDGELYIHGMPLEDLMSITSRTACLHENYDAVEYKVFDVVDLLRPQVERLNVLYQGVKPAVDKADDIQVVEAFTGEGIDEMNSFLQDFMDKGYEGAILRHPDGVYRRTRSTSMMKIKPSYTDVYEIVGTEEEFSIAGFPKNSLGSLCCRSQSNDLFFVGSGFTRDEREELWKKREELVGKFAEVRYQDITAANCVPRHSRIVQILDTNPEVPSA